MAGDEKASYSSGDKHPAYLDPSVMEGDYEGKPSEEELQTLRRVPGSLPTVAYLICIVVPYPLGGISELFVNVPAYGIAYSRAPVNMRGLVSAINLFNAAIVYAIGLACSLVITDPYLVWDFGGVTIAGGVMAVLFYVLFRHIDTEEYTVSQNADYHLELEGTVNVLGENELNKSRNRPAPIADNE